MADMEDTPLIIRGTIWMEINGFPSVEALHAEWPERRIEDEVRSLLMPAPPTGPGLGYRRGPTYELADVQLDLQIYTQDESEALDSQ